MRDYKYMKEDFKELPAKLKHMDIYLDFRDGKVFARNTLFFTSSFKQDKICLDADELVIISVKWSDGTELSYDYNKNGKKLLISLPQEVVEGEEFCISTETECIPSDNNLEGIYNDVTPKGAPQQYMSQCQQWGFQRIMPVIDDCRAKCTMRTTLEGDSRYTHLISNGNIDRTTNPEGIPVKKEGDSRRMTITYINEIPMAPYLFIACAGTWDVLSDELTYPEGKKVMLEYLVPPGKTEQVRIPMDILKKSISWIKDVQDYEYTGDVYRTITMTKSNFGGMENVGNTTIVTDSALIDEHTLDGHIIYAHRVIVHEFEHNQCGSETTMETPFDMWLNEAYTVDVERQFTYELFDPTYMRAEEVGSIRNPLLGPLAIEDSGYGGRIEREGFNHPNELVDGVTYVKAAEVIRMLRLVMGKGNFIRAKKEYFSRFRHKNANTDQFFSCFEEVHGESLDDFKNGWLKRAGYPKVTVEESYEDGKYIIDFVQEAPGGKPFVIPIDLALVGSDGKDIFSQVFIMKENHSKLEIAAQEKPLFASINRDSSFYGILKEKSKTRGQRILQVRKDPNLLSRVEAMKELTDLERIKLMKDIDSVIDPEWLKLYGEILLDKTIPPMLKSMYLSIGESPKDRDYTAWYVEMVQARERILKEISSMYRDEIIKEFHSTDTYGDMGLEEGIMRRSLKQILLSLIAAEDNSVTHQILVDHLKKARSASERVSCLVHLNRGSYEGKKEILEKTYESWNPNLNGYANYLRVISSGEGENVFEDISRERKRPTFDMSQPSFTRSLLVPMAMNNKVIWTDKGISWLTDTIIEFSPINDYVAGKMLHAYQHVQRMRPYLREKVIPNLQRIADSVKEDTVKGQAKAYLSKK